MSASRALITYLLPGGRRWSSGRRPQPAMSITVGSQSGATAATASTQARTLSQAYSELASRVAVAMAGSRL